MDVNNAAECLNDRTEGVISNEDYNETMEIPNSSLNTDDIVRNLVGNDTENVTHISPTVDSQDAILDSLLDSVLNESAESNVHETEDGIAAENNSLDLETSNDNNDAPVVPDTDDITETEDPLIEYNIEYDPTEITTELKTEKLCQLPLGRVKTIMKSDPDVNIVSAETIFLISKATEFFLQWLGKEVHSYTVRQKKKTIQLRDLNMAISDHPALEFLDGALD